MASEPETNNNEAPAQKRGRFSKDTLNLVVAVCAVLISAASFVATYLQSDAAYRQVKAETWPYLQLSSSNYDVQSDSKVISLNLENAGVGPAAVKSFTLFYDNQPVETVWHLMLACCADKGTDRMTFVQSYIDGSPDAPIITSGVSGQIMPSGNGASLFIVPRDASNADLWDVFDKARHKLRGKACYCSLLGECYQTDFRSDPVEVKVCPANPHKDYNG
ncbi:hypothetical protein [Kordiimonas sp.]|uniref:hypothetical protein n=1 Tax=Kordiimonas sp. TaxID=1970157 RepID=UPI003A915401